MNNTRDKNLGVFYETLIDLNSVGKYKRENKG
jgi:hypothetical protein